MNVNVPMNDVKQNKKKQKKTFSKNFLFIYVNIMLIDLEYKSLLLHYLCGVLIFYCFVPFVPLPQQVCLLLLLCK